MERKREASKREKPQPSAVTFGCLTETTPDMPRDSQLRHTTPRLLERVEHMKVAVGRRMEVTQKNIITITTRRFGGNQRYVLVMKSTSTPSNMPHWRPIQPKSFAKKEHRTQASYARTAQGNRRSVAHSRSFRRRHTKKSCA